MSGTPASGREGDGEGGPRRRHLVLVVLSRKCFVPLSRRVVLLLQLWKWPVVLHKEISFDENPSGLPSPRARAARQGRAYASPQQPRGLPVPWALTAAAAPQREVQNDIKLLYY